MNKFTKTLAAMMLIVAAVIAAGCKKNDEPNDGGGSFNDHDYVDLGLPSGTLWATCNIGAEKPEDYGDYFAWGETMPKESYSWSNYKYGSYVDNRHEMTKYCTDAHWGHNGFFDNKTVLDSVDDAAWANWGDDWRMPTKEDWRELYLKTTCTWTELNGVKGELLTSWNGNSIFLPAAGCHMEEVLDSTVVGIYWTSSLQTDLQMIAWSFHFTLDGCHVCGSYERVRGQVIRAVRAER